MSVICLTCGQKLVIECNHRTKSGAQCSQRRGYQKINKRNSDLNINGQSDLGSTSVSVPFTRIYTQASTQIVFTFLEQQVYDYLFIHRGQVCDRESIKRAVWREGNEPTNTALQKIIERIRLKIEKDPSNPQYLIAVRGTGYMYR